MLVFTRRVAETVVITVPPSDVEQTILVDIVDIRRGEIRIGFDAAREITINRGEVQERQAG